MMHVYVLYFCPQDPRDCSMSNPLPGDCPREVEIRGRIGAHLWLRCRLALVHSLAAHISATAAFFPGMVMCCTFLSFL